jgi:hypothetical protein
MWLCLHELQVGSLRVVLPTRNHARIIGWRRRRLRPGVTGPWQPASEPECAPSRPGGKRTSTLQVELFNVNRPGNATVTITQAADLLVSRIIVDSHRRRALRVSLSASYY